MSFRRALWAFAVVVVSRSSRRRPGSGDYLDVYTVKVKPEKSRRLPSTHQEVG